MATDKQILANQRNAGKSSGPRTPEGKARSSQNAVKTGAFSRLLLLADESKTELDRLRTALYDEWRPVGPTETCHVERLAALFWKQRRFYHAETGLYSMYRQCAEGLGGVATALAREGTETEAFSRLMHLDAVVERSIGITLGRLEKLQ